jgi:hypothetical protein
MDGYRPWDANLLPEVSVVAEGEGKGASAVRVMDGHHHHHPDYRDLVAT